MPRPPIEIPERYELTGTVLSGGQGDVFVCRDTWLERDVAIKFIRNSTAPETLEGEILALSTIQSKHVIDLFDLLREPSGDSVGIVLEYLPGNDLSHFIPRTKTEFLSVLFQIASGLADIHEAGKIHRDIKPKNIKRDGANIIKLFDFGLTCDMSDAETDAGRGTRQFRAPEYYAGYPVTLDQGVDTYAFGVTTWHFATQSSLPWELRKTPPSEPPSLATVTTLLPSTVINLIDACLSSSSAVRPTMQDVRDEIGRQILFGRHRAFFSDGANTYFLDSKTRAIRVSAATTGSAKITYDGLRFFLAEVKGDVSVNGNPAADGHLLPDSCVIILGDKSLGASRTFLTFDVSHPEVLL